MNSPAAEHPIAKRLGDRGVTTIAIVDDAFDPPLLSDVASGVEHFWAEVEANAAAVSELCLLANKPVTTVGDIDDKVVQSIWEARDTLQTLKPAYDQCLSADLAGRVAPLERLQRTLIDDLGRNAKCYGRMNQLTEASAQMVFVDYYMGPGRDDEAVKAAKDVVSSISDLYKASGSLPVIVLMSSVQVSPEMVEDFRQRSGWLAGMFYFVHKADFNDIDTLFMRLVTFAQALPAGHQIHLFVDALSSRIHDVANRFIDDIKALSLGDYAYLQIMSLQEDGHPLGDYMLWLYGAYFGQLLFHDDAVRAQRREIDKLVFEGLPPIQSAPSDILAKLYFSAIVEPVESDLSHPRAPEGSVAAPRLHLGDIFIGASIASDVLIIINAQCDLAFAPDTESRPFRADRSILLMPGTLQLLQESISQFDAKKPRTEVFQHDKQYYRIHWEPKRVRAISYGEVSSKLQQEGYTLAARLHLPFALQVQQAFAGDLTRVGLPNAPPMYRGVNSKLYCQGEDGKAALLVEAPEGGFIFSTHDGDRCILTDDFVLDVKGSLVTAIQKLNDHIAKLQEYKADGKIKIAERARDSLDRLNGTIDATLVIRGPFKAPGVGVAVQLGQLPIVVQRGGDVAGTYRTDQPLLIHINDL